MMRHLCLAVAVAVLSLCAAPASAGPKKPEKKAVVGLDPDLANEIFAVVERGTRSGDMETRAMAVGSIARVKPEVVKDYVVDALQDPQWVVRYHAIKALIVLKNEAYRPILAAAVANRTLYDNPTLNPIDLVLMLPPTEAIQLIEEALVKVEDVRGILLAEIFRKDSPLARDFYEGLRKIPAVKSWVMSNLEIFKDQAMYPLLLKTLPEFSKSEVLTVFAFMEGLDKSYDVSILDGYLKDKDDEIVEGAAFVLALRGNEKAVEVVLPICDENEIRRQLHCLKSIKGAPTNPEVLERAKLFLYGDPDPEVLYATYDIFALAGDDSVYQRMLQTLQSTNLGHRAAAVYFLGRVKGNRALPKLHEMLRDGSPLIRMRAAQAIGDLRQAESVVFLADALRNDTDATVRKELVKALGKIAERAIVEEVAFLIFDPVVRDEAIDALCGVRHAEAIPTLRNILQTQFTKEQRTMALKSIIRISPAEGYTVFKGCLGWIPEGFLDDMAKELKGDFVSYLKAALDSINERVRQEAVLAFRHLGGETEVKVLEQELFKAKDTRLRVLVLQRLADIKTEGGLDLLSAFFKDSNKELRLAAIRLAAARAVPESPAVEQLRGMLMDPDESFRVASAVALLDIFKAGVGQ